MCIVLDAETTKRLVKELNTVLREIDENVSEKHCFDDAIETFRVLDRQLRTGLGDHSGGLVLDCKTTIDNYRRQLQEHNKKHLQFEGEDLKHKIESWKMQLDQLQPSSWGSRCYGWYRGTTYDRLHKELQGKVRTRFSQGKKALQTRDHEVVQECIAVLQMISQHLGKHVAEAADRLGSLRKLTLNSFQSTCERVQSVLASDRRSEEFESVFADYSSLVLAVPCVMASTDANKSFSLTNQLIFEALDHGITLMKGLAEVFDFENLKSKVEHLRAFGGFLTDRCILFHEQVKCCTHADVDVKWLKWLEQLSELCSEHFGCTRDLSRMKYYAVRKLGWEMRLHTYCTSARY